MKSFAVLAVVAGVASAQSLGSCAQMCADNMAKIAETQFMCGAGDVACFCSKSNWANGLRDCSAQACDATQAAQAVAWGNQQCAGVATGAPSASAAVSVLSSVAGSASGVLASASASASAAVSSAVASGAQSVPVTTVPLLATITNSAGSVVTQTTGFSTVYSHLTGGAASAASSVASAQASAASSASGAVASALSSVSAALSSGASAAASSAHASGSAGSTGAPSSGAAVPMMTAMPLAAAAGAAAMFFL